MSYNGLNGDESFTARLGSLLAWLLSIVALGGILVAMVAFLVAAMLDKFEITGEYLALNVATFALGASILAWLLIIVRTKTADVPVRAWPRILALVASGFIILSPFVQLTEHLLIGGLKLYDLNILCAIIFTSAGAVTFTVWLMRRRLLQIAMLPFLAGLFAWVVILYQRGQENVKQMMISDNELAASFAKMVSEHETIGRGWYTLVVPLSVLAIVTIIDNVVSWLHKDKDEFASNK
jgi:hypothetical protein